MEPLHFDELPDHCIDKFRRSHPELSPFLSNKEVMIIVYGNASTVIYGFYGLIRDFLVERSDRVSIEQRTDLLNAAIEQLYQKLLFFTDQGVALEALCGSATEVKNYLSEEGEVFLVVFKEMVIKHHRLLTLHFVEGFSKNTSHDSLLYSHQTINQMLLKSKVSLGTKGEFEDALIMIMIKQCENLLDFYNEEMRRYENKHIASNPISIARNVPPTFNRQKLKSDKEKTQKEGTEQMSFNDLFIPPYHNHIEKFIDVLYRCIPQVISNDGSVVKRADNGIIRIFFRTLAEKGIIKYSATRSSYGRIIADKFSGLKPSFIDSRAKDNKIVHEVSRIYFQDEIDKHKKYIDLSI